VVNLKIFFDKQAYFIDKQHILSTNKAFRQKFTLKYLGELKAVLLIIWMGQLVVTSLNSELAEYLCDVLHGKKVYFLVLISW